APFGYAESVSLKMNEAVGQSWKFERKQTTVAKNQATMNGQTQSFETKSQQHHAGTVQVLATKDGVPTSIRVVFDKDCTITNEMNTNTNTVTIPYAGETITVTRAADGTVSDDFKGQVDPDTLADLHGMLDT